MVSLVCEGRGKVGGYKRSHVRLFPGRIPGAYQVADYLTQHCAEDTAIDTVSAAFGFSTGYLVRAFKRHFNMTPHAYRLNRRVQIAQRALKQGKAIAAVAHDAGFSDQPHFQRVFKQRVAATPAQYRSEQLQQQQDTAKRK